MSVSLSSAAAAAADTAVSPFFFLLPCGTLVVDADVGVACPDPGPLLMPPSLNDVCRGVGACDDDELELIAAVL